MDAYTPIVPFDVLSRRLGRRPEEIIKLDANENPYGPSPRVYEVLGDALGDAGGHGVKYHIYPDPGSTALREALGEYTGIDASAIVAGHGADELIDLVIRLFVSPGDAVLNCPPTFGMYGFDTTLNGGTVVDVPRKEDFSIDMEGLMTTVGAVTNRAYHVSAGLAASEPMPTAKLLFLTNPNNPDGGLLPDAALRELLALPLIVVLDEAYIEFSAAPSRAHWVLEHENLIVLRTLSKWAGLAGLRVGYGIFPQWILAHLLKIKQPYNVNVAGTAAAIASLADVAYLMENVAKLVAERERLFKGLAGFDFLVPYPSHANFVLCRVVGRDAAELQADLARQGILIRYFNTPGLQEHIRISVGKPAETDALLRALR